jgi:hypothetical protein
MSPTRSFKLSLEAAILHITNLLECSWKAAQGYSLRQWRKVKTAIEVDGGGSTCPQAETVVLSLSALFIFLTIAIVAIRFPTIATRHAVLASSAILAGAVGMTFVWDVRTSKSTTLQ